MKKTKIIIPALGMLLLSTAASITGTVAWFSANQQVTASGMNIRATSGSAYLVISETENGTFDTDANAMVLNPAVDNETGAPALKLVTPLNVASNVAYYANQTDASAEPAVTTTPSKFTNAASVLWGTANSSDPTQVQASNVPSLVGGTGFDNGTIANYVQSSELWFKILPGNVNATNLKCSKVTFTAGTNSIAASGRALIVSETGKYQLFKLTNGDVTSTLSGDTSLLAEVTTTAQKLTCFFYFDGTDDVAYTNMATDLSAVTASFTFNVD